MSPILKTNRLQEAVAYAKTIRKNLLKSKDYSPYLHGACGIASITLAYKLNDIKTLRLKDAGKWQHVYNVVDGVIIDITATQFYADAAQFWSYYASSKCDYPKRGLYISKNKLGCHYPVHDRGASVYKYIVEDWYYEHRGLDKIIKNWPL